MSTHNICFCRKIRKILCGYSLLSVAMVRTYGRNITAKRYMPTPAKAGGGIKICSKIILNPSTADHNNCRLLCHLLVILNFISPNSVDPDQTRCSLIWVQTVCLYAKIGLKSLQKYSADDIYRRHFQMQVCLAL